MATIPKTSEMPMSSRCCLAILDLSIQRYWLGERSNMWLTGTDLQWIFCPLSGVSKRASQENSQSRPNWFVRNDHLDSLRSSGDTCTSACRQGQQTWIVTMCSYGCSHCTDLLIGTDIYPIALEPYHEFSILPYHKTAKNICYSRYHVKWVQSSGNCDDRHLVLR